MTDQTKTPGAMVLVPRVATEQMLSAMWSIMNSNGVLGTQACYEAMLAAAPQPPALNECGACGGCEGPCRLDADSPPALGGEPEVIAYLRATPDGKPELSEDCVCEDPVYPNFDGDETFSMPVIRLGDHRAHLAPLQAEIEDLKADRDAWKETAESFEDFYRKTEAELGDLRVAFDNASNEGDTLLRRAKDAECERDQFKARNAELKELLRQVVALDPRGEFMGWELDSRIDAALSKPADQQGDACSVSSWQPLPDNWCRDIDSDEPYDFDGAGHSDEINPAEGEQV